MGTRPNSKPIIKPPRLIYRGELLGQIEDKWLRAEIEKRLEHLKKQIELSTSKISPIPKQEGRQIQFWHEEIKKLIEEHREKIPLEVLGPLEQYLSEVRKKYLGYLEREEINRERRGEDRILF